MISRWRRSRTRGDYHDKHSTILPSTYYGDASSPSTPPEQKEKKKRPPPPLPRYLSPMNSSYLKRSTSKPFSIRRGNRSNALWFRLFCSNPTKMMCTTILLFGIILWYWILPLWYWTFKSHGNVNSANVTTVAGGDATTILAAGSIEKVDNPFLNIWLQPLDIMMSNANALQDRLNRLQQSERTKNMAVLEDIIPEWFHQNIANGVGKKGKRRTEIQGIEQKLTQVFQNDDGDTSDHISVVEVDDSKREKNRSRPASSNAKTSKQVLRILQNTAQHATQSKCPTTPNLSTTLVIQTTTDRLLLIPKTCERWLGPIVLVIYYLPSGTDEIENLHHWHILTNDLTTACPHMSIVQYKGMSTLEQTLEYPVNVLRNIGLDEVQTSHVLVMDVDFIPSKDVFEIVQGTLLARQTKGKLEDWSKNAIIVPAFERKLSKPCTSMEDCMKHFDLDPEFIPTSIDGLTDCVKQKECIVFQSDNNWEGHSSTRSERWLEGKWYDDDHEKAERNVAVDYNREMRRIKCFDTLRYEPYVVIPWCPTILTTESKMTPKTTVSPYYDERFHGYGKNKIQQISHLRLLGYRFSVLPKGFITHHPHPESKTKETWNNVGEFDLHAKMDQLYPRYLKELSVATKHVHDVTPICQSPKSYPEKKKQ